MINRHNDEVPYYVAKAEQFVRDNANRSLSIDELASAAGVSSRTLYSGFRRYRNTTPMDHVRRVRLERANQELTAVDPTQASVREVAERWGFSHLGRFAARYREIFGENPSTTLRRASNR